ncbi:hypothetical protein Lser_V15G35343 [Lactuca serriola]
MSEHRGHKQHDIDFSNLPDCILDQILSFMPTKDAVKTSVLSTRWKNLWVSVPNIDFDDALLCAREVDGWRRPHVTSFVNFVERVLRLCNPSKMEKFRLSCRVFRDAFQIRSWISHAIMHNVQELDLSLFAKDPSMIPRSVFHNTSLVSLKIRMDCAIQLPSHVSFPCLKALQLSYVQFLHDDFTETFLSGCPVLEKLILFNNSFKSNITISSSSLKSLTIRDLSRFGEIDDLSGCKIKIGAENLICFEYIGYLSNRIMFSDTSSLDISFINIPTHNERLQKVANRAIDLLKQLQYVVSLRLSNLTLQGLMHLGENNLIWSSIPICMSNCLKIVAMKNFHGYDSEICLLKNVLKTARVLERMDIRWSETYLRDLKRKTNARKELEKIVKSSPACVIKFS